MEKDKYGNEIKKVISSRNKYIRIFFIVFAAGL